MRHARSVVLFAGFVVASVLTGCGSTTEGSDGAAAEVHEAADAPTADVVSDAPGKDSGPGADTAGDAPAGTPDADTAADVPTGTADADTAADTPASSPDADGTGPLPDEGDEADATPPPPIEVVEISPGLPRCQAHADCDDHDPCTIDSCLVDGCTHVTAADQSPCDDGNPCTTGDTCQAGACVAGPALACDDGNPCTVDVCGLGRGCTHLGLSDTPCDDADPCTGGDACLAGACQPGTLDACPVCGDGACGDPPYETCETCPADCGACVEDCVTPGDEDLDGLADCQDAECPPCVEDCVTPGDEDFDGLADCADPDCPCVELCATPGDEDVDGLADCADPDCASQPACLPPVCAGFVPLACGGSSWGNPAGYAFDAYTGCAASGGDGSDDGYVVTLPAGMTEVAITLSIDDTGGIFTDGDDLDVYVLDACDAAACVASATSSSSTEYVTAYGAPGQTFYVLVELYELGFWGYGDYSLYVDCY